MSKGHIAGSHNALARPDGKMSRRHDPGYSSYWRAAKKIANARRRRRDKLEAHPGCRRCADG